jgi:hypothetical protein
LRNFAIRIGSTDHLTKGIRKRKEGCGKVDLKERASQCGAVCAFRFMISALGGATILTGAKMSYLSCVSFSVHAGEISSQENDKN